MAADDPLAAALEPIRQHEQAATEGPWWSDEDETCWRLHGVMGRIPPQLDGLVPEQIMNRQILKAPKHGTPYAEYWPDDADAAFIVGAREWVPRLLAVVDAVLKPHQPGRIVISGALCARHENHRHFSITQREADDVIACEACPATVYTSCAGCDGSVPFASCAVRAAITRELTGEVKASG